MKKKRSLVLLLLLAVLCLFATAALAAGTTTTNSNSNLRSGAGTQYERLAIIPAGTQVTVEEADPGTGWTKITYNGQTGYVVTRYLGTGTDATAAGSYTTTARVHLRSGPGTTNASIMILPKGATVSVSTSANGWAAVNYNGTGGYIASQYLAAASGAAATPSTTVTGNTGAAGSASATTTANVNLRDAASTSGKVLTTVPKGASVTVTGTANGWASVTYNGTSGYMSTKYLSGLAGGGGSTSSNYTTTAKVNLRNGPSTSSAVVTEVPKGATVTVTSTSNGWSAVTYDGKSGYIASQYLAAAGTTPNTTVTGNTGAAGSTSATTTANVNLRDAASTSGKVLTTVPKGASVTVTGTSNGWASVTYNGTSGYMSTKYLSGLAGSGGSTSTTKKTTAKVNLRNGPSTSNAVITTVPKGATVTVTSTSNGWSAVTYDGKSGYIASQYLS